MAVVPSEDAIEPTDAELFQRSVDGDGNAWDMLYRRHTPRLWAIARAQELDATSAADVVQTTWLNLVSGMASIRKPESVGAWLSTTTRHEAIRVAKFRRLRGPGATPDELHTDPRPEPAEVVAAASEKSWLFSALDRLDDECQMLLSLLFMSEEPPAYQVVSDMIGWPIGSIGPRRQRCLEKLRRIIER